MASALYTPSVVLYIPQSFFRARIFLNTMKKTQITISLMFHDLSQLNKFVNFLWFSD